jgi:predicted SnoaL-like aldol condensation-catalyzing enzyme
MKNMQIKLLGGAILLLAMASGPMAAQSNTPESKNQDMVLNWYRDAIMLGHVDEASKHMADDYIEHDARISGGKAGFVRYYQNPSSRPAEAKQITSFGQGDYVVIVWSRADKDPKSSTPYNYTTYDVVRIKNGKIQEHWNNAKQNTKW